MGLRKRMKKKEVAADDVPREAQNSGEWINISQNYGFLCHEISMENAEDLLATFSEHSEVKRLATF